MPYPAPVDVGAVSGVECYLVFIPDDDAYRQAAMDAYISLADRWNWGKDAPHPDSATIEQHWLDAIEMTLEEIGMSKLDQIITLIDEIEPLLTQILGGLGCCPENLTYGPSDTVGNPNNYVYGGNHPNTWGESEDTTAQEDYDELLCGYAHDYVDLLIAQALQLEQLMGTGLLALAAIVAILGILATGGLTLLIGAAAASAVFAAISELWVTDVFTDAADAIETARDDIICAMLYGDGSDVGAEIEAVVSATAWAILFQWIDYQSAINVGLTGELNGEYVEPRYGETCPCTPTGPTVAVMFELQSFVSSLGNKSLSLFGWEESLTGYNDSTHRWAEDQWTLPGERSYCYDSASAYTPPAHAKNVTTFDSAFTVERAQVAWRNDNVVGDRDCDIVVHIYRILETSPSVFTEVLWTDAVLDTPPAGITILNGVVTFDLTVSGGTYIADIRESP